MKYQEYQALDKEQKMLARFRSLDTVLQAARAEHVTYDDIEEPSVQNRRRILQGVVTSSKDNETVTVHVERRFAHPVLKNTIRKSRKYRAHKEADGSEDSQETILKPGDWVVIQRDVSRPD